MLAGVVNDFPQQGMTGGMPLTQSQGQEVAPGMSQESTIPSAHSSPLQMAIRAFRGRPGRVHPMSRMTIFGRSSAGGRREVVGEVIYSNDLSRDGVIVSVREQ